MLRCVALVRTDVSEEPGASFIRVTRIGELGTTKAATSNRRTLRRNTKCSQLIFPLPLISPGDAFAGHCAQFCARAPCSRELAKLTVARSADDHWHSNGHLETVRATRECTRVFLTTALPRATEALAVLVGDFCSKIQNFVNAHGSLPASVV
jgi:hypothetical protein